MLIIIINLSIFIPAVTGNTNKNNKTNENNALKILSNIKESKIRILKNTIHTNCNGYEKATEITFGKYNKIDIDNNTETGENGADIKVQYLILPWIEFSPSISIGLIFTVLVERINNEINNSDFKIWLEVGQKNIEIGYLSPNETGNEIPDSTRISFVILFGLQEKTHTYSFILSPKYNSGSQNKKIQLFAQHNDEDTQRGFSFEFNPATEIKTTMRTIRDSGKWNYEFTRESSEESQVTSTFIKNDKETKITVDKLPSNLKFSLELTPLSKGGGRFIYESDKSYDIDLTVNSNQQGNCKYATIKNTPKKIQAEWTPTLLNGSYSLQIDSNGTDFILQDQLTNPTTILKVNNIKTIDIDANWNLSNPGDFIVRKNHEINANIDIIIGEWNAKLLAEPTADYVETTWNLGLTGYLSIDTGWNTLSTMDLLVQSEDLGVHTEGETFKSDDFKLEWVLWPIQDLKIVRYGEVESTALDIDLNVNDAWYNIWPLL